MRTDIQSVTEITKYIKAVVEHDLRLNSVVIRGEISNFKQYSSGHCYFTLKDAGAALKAVMFRSRAQQLRFTPENGMKVLASGAISVYERDGVYQLYTDSLVPEGAGELSIAFEQLKQRLAAEGLFAEDRKQPLPFFAKTIGVVTSASGAVLRDIYRVAKRRNPAVKLVLYPVQVQGENSAAQIAEAIVFFNRFYPADLLIVGRGGGSMEDLWSFNEEAVVRAIAESGIPVISAVGHETDFTLADFAADVRAATPSQAAELAVKDAKEWYRYIQALTMQLQLKAGHQINRKRSRLEQCIKKRVMTMPRTLLAEKKQRLDYLSERCRELSIRQKNEKRHQLEILLERLSLLNPVSVLQRGYGIVQKDGRIIKKSSEAVAGDLLEITLQDGSLFTKVIAAGEEPDNGKSKKNCI